MDAETIAALERERNGGERAQIVAYLEKRGITRLDIDDGFWDTSTGCDFGQSILDAIAAGAHQPQIITGQSLHVYATWDDSKESEHVAGD